MKRYFVLLGLIMSFSVRISAQSLRSFENGVLEMEYSDFAMDPFEIPVVNMNSDEIGGYLPEYFKKKAELSGEDRFCSGEKSVTYSGIDELSVLQFADCEYEILLKIDLQENALKIRYGIRLGQTAADVLKKLHINFPGSGNPIDKMIIYNASESYKLELIYKNNTLVRLVFLPKAE